MARKGIPYSRFSRKSQEAGDSQRRQDALAEEAARAEGVELDRTINIADEGISAFRGANWKRGDLGKFLDLVDAGVIPRGSVLIVEQVNRLSRMPWMQQVELWKEILSRGIVIRTCVPPARYTQANMNELAVGCPVVIYMMLAHLDSQQKSEWLKQTWGQKKVAASKGVPHGRACAEWLQPITEPHPKDPARVVTVRYEMIESRRQLIEQIYQWALRGWGAMRILRELNTHHLPAWNRAARLHAKRTGGAPKWRLGWVKYLLTTRQVIGEYQPLKVTDAGISHDGGPVAEYYPAAISEDLFNAVQAARRKRRRTGGRPGVDGLETNLFTGLVHDSLSGRRLGVENCGVDGERYRTLASDPPSARVPYDRFESAVLDAVSQLRASDVDGRVQADELTSLVDRLQAERARLDLELEALDQQIRELPPERWPRRVVARMAELEASIASTDEALRVAKEKADTSGRSEALTEVQTCVELLGEVKGSEREAGVRQRIKSRLPLLVESIWVAVQPINRMCRVIHVQVYLHGGRRKYFIIRAGNPKKGAPPLWRLDSADFRAGDVTRYAVDPRLGGDGIAHATAG